MYASKDRKTAKEGKRPTRPPEPLNRNGSQLRAGSANNNLSQEEDERTLGLIRDFLQKQGYNRTFEIFKTERPNRRMSARG